MTAQIVTIPEIVRARGSATQQTQLDGRVYIFTWQWNQRLSRWSMSIADQDASPIASGVVLVSGFPLLSLVTDERAPAGTIGVYDTQTPSTDPTLDSLGLRHLVLYYPVE